MACILKRYSEPAILYPCKFLFPLLLFAVSIFSQDTKEMIPVKLKQDVVNISTNNNISVGYSLPFSAVKIMDYRFDTSKIGFAKSKAVFTSSSYSFKKIAVKNGLQSAVESFYNAYYKNRFSKDSTQLLIVIKRFWADPLPNLQVQQQATKIYRESSQDLYIQFEFFFNRGGWYLPLKRVDTVFQVTSELNLELYSFKEKQYGLYEYALTKVFESPNYLLYADRIENSKNRRTLEEVIRFNNKRFSYPILIDTVLKKGVYLNFSEFRNNQPAITEFKITEKRKIGKLLFNNNGNDRTQIINFWGYCDGTNIYSGGLQYPLYRAGNTFEFFNDGIGNYMYTNDIKSQNTANGDYRVSTPYTASEKILEPFQIDMETGKIY